MAVTNYYVRPVTGNDIAGQGTSHAAAYQTLQFALNDIGGTHGQGARGDQVNLCDEGPNVNAASLSLAAYGAPTATRPLIIRGYTLTANDGGIGEIDCNGATMWLVATNNYTNLIDLEIHNPGNNHLVQLGNLAMIVHCYLHAGVSAPVAKYCININGEYPLIINSRIPSFGTGNWRAIQHTGNYARILYNSIVCNGQIIIFSGDINLLAQGNIIYANGAAWGIYSNANYSHITHNAIFANVGNTGVGIRCSPARRLQNVYNNILVNFSGVGAIAVDMQSDIGATIGNNAFWNNTSNYSNVTEIVNDIRANDVALAADPFADAAAGNFMLTPAAQAVLRSAGWPSTYLGATSTDSQLTVGPVQYGEGGGGRRAHLQKHGV